jgi:hypothetical protein
MPMELFYLLPLLRFGQYPCAPFFNNIDATVQSLKESLLSVFQRVTVILQLHSLLSRVYPAINQTIPFYFSLYLLPARQTGALRCIKLNYNTHM